MKPLCEVIHWLGVWNHQDTDDTQFYLSTLAWPTEAVKVPEGSVDIYGEKLSPTQSY